MEQLSPQLDLEDTQSIKYLRTHTENRLQLFNLSLIVEEKNYNYLIDGVHRKG